MNFKYSKEWAGKARGKRKGYSMYFSAKAHCKPGSRQYRYPSAVLRAHQPHTYFDSCPLLSLVYGDGGRTRCPGEGKDKAEMEQRLSIPVKTHPLTEPVWWRWSTYREATYRTVLTTPVPVPGFPVVSHTFI